MSDRTGMMAQSTRGDVMVVHGVEMLTRDQAAARRETLVKQLGLPESELRRRADDYDLSAEEQAVYERIEDLDYLLRVVSPGR